LAYRMETTDAISLIPAIIEQVSGKLEARLHLGETSRPTVKGPTGPMYAAMLTLYGDPARRAACGHDPQTGKAYDPKTGDEVWAEIVLCQHEISPRDKTQWQQDFQFWKVVTVWPKHAFSTPPAPTGGTPWPTLKPETHLA